MSPHETGDIFRLLQQVCRLGLATASESRRETRRERCSPNAPGKNNTERIFQPSLPFSFSPCSSSQEMLARRVPVLWALNDGPDNENISWYPVAHPLEGVRVFQPVGKVVGYPRKKPSGVKGLSYRVCPLSDCPQSDAIYLRIASKLCHCMVRKLKPHPKRRLRVFPKRSHRASQDSR